MHVPPRWSARPLVARRNSLDFRLGIREINGRGRALAICCICRCQGRRVPRALFPVVLTGLHCGLAVGLGLRLVVMLSPVVQAALHCDVRQRRSTPPLWPNPPGIHGLSLTRSWSPSETISISEAHLVHH